MKLALKIFHHIKNVTCGLCSKHCVELILLKTNGRVDETRFFITGCSQLIKPESHNSLAEWSLLRHDCTLCSLHPHCWFGLQQHASIQNTLFNTLSETRAALRVMQAFCSYGHQTMTSLRGNVFVTAVSPLGTSLLLHFTSRNTTGLRLVLSLTTSISVKHNKK